MSWLEKQTMKAGDPIFKNRAEQVAAYLRERLASEQWGARLPPERDLAQQFGVSRWTLRAAIEALQREGLIGRRSQAGTRIVRGSSTSGQAHQISVGLVMVNSADPSTSRISFLLEQMRHYLQAQGARLEVHLTYYLRTGGVSSHFKQLIRSNQHDCWVLLSPLESMELWCAERRAPVIVLGTASEASKLPYASLDFRAVCRHAVGTMISRGHRRLAMILSETLKSDDKLSRLGFEEGVRESSREGVEVCYEVHDQSHKAIMRLADRLLAQPDYPTAWLICRQGSFARFFTYLLHRQVRIPEQLSVLCRDEDHYFGEFLPRPTCYRLNKERLVHRATRLALRVAMGQAQPRESVLETPELVPGETLGAPWDLKKT